MTGGTDNAVGRAPVVPGRPLRPPGRAAVGSARPRPQAWRSTTGTTGSTVAPALVPWATTPVGGKGRSAVPVACGWRPVR